jgi:hypothetical protein
MSSVEEANARNMLRRRAEELIAVGERLGKRMIDFKSEKHSIFEKRRQGAVGDRTASLLGGCAQ